MEEVEEEEAAVVEEGGRRLEAAAAAGVVEGRGNRARGATEQGNPLWGSRG